MTGGFFPPTRASVVEALRSGDAAERERALGTLVAAYWRPVYRHVRRKWGKGHEEAADLTQDFFAELLTRDLLARYDARKARLRTYLRLCVDGLAANAAKAASRQKRGGGAAPLSLDFEGAREELERRAPGSDETPERAFETEWARSVLALALERLAVALEGRGKGIAHPLFEICELGAGAEAPSYAELAERFGVSVSDVTNGLSLARREFRRTVLDLLRELTGSEEELRLETRALLGIDVP
ncbi:MAG TPA: sigma-70 family RNA polymerase sigma factor [Thermoanaerobaculia bacterium]|nr:sigma-70 family RNA polymerase sigma factor [Thermoanaerobaculia bacterium]HQP85014.1 sigma-70 family RNA polymerase sigma factor [Thermoanaerobaculia bacterium]